MALHLLLVFGSSYTVWPAPLNLHMCGFECENIICVGDSVIIRLIDLSSSISHSTSLHFFSSFPFSLLRWFQLILYARLLVILPDVLYIFVFFSTHFQAKKIVYICWGYFVYVLCFQVELYFICIVFDVKCAFFFCFSPLQINEK